MKSLWNSIKVFGQLAFAVLVISIIITIVISIFSFSWIVGCAVVGLFALNYGLNSLCKSAFRDIQSNANIGSGVISADIINKAIKEVRDEQRP